MHAVYSYKTTATTAQVLRDIILLLTGTTNLASLSASCDQATSAVNSTFGVGNNNDYDAGASANAQQCWRMSAWDVSTDYFYPALQITTTTLVIGGYTSWNTGTHAGAGGFTGTGSGSVTLALIGTTAGKIYIWTDGKGAVITSSASTYCVAVLPITREDAWRTSAGGYLPVVFSPATNLTVLSQPTAAFSATMAWTFKSVTPALTPAVTTAGSNYSNVTSMVADVPNGVCPLGGIMQSGLLNSSLVLEPTIFPIRAGGLAYFGNGYGVPYGGSVTTISPIYFYAGASVPTKDDDIIFGAEVYKSMGSGTNVCVRVT